jgi:hypothetical protein
MLTITRWMFGILPCIVVIQAQQIDTVDTYACAIQPPQRFACWGQLPFSMPLINNALTLSTSPTFACVLLTTNNIVCLGNNSTGILNVPSSVGFQFLDSDPSSNSAYACAIDNSVYGLWCWGTLPPGVPSWITGPWQSVSLGKNNVCAILATNQSLTCYGSDNTNGQQNVPMTIQGWLSVTHGSTHVCGILNDATSICFGLNNVGQSSPPSSTYMQLLSLTNSGVGLTTTGNLIVFGALANFPPPVASGSGYIQMAMGPGTLGSVTTLVSRADPKGLI